MMAVISLKLLIFFGYLKPGPVEINYHVKAVLVILFIMALIFYKTKRINTILDKYAVFKLDPSYASLIVIIPLIVTIIVGFI